jgi:hypothetical protein
MRLSISLRTPVAMTGLIGGIISTATSSSI